MVSSPDTFAVYLHLPYKGYTCFLFQQDGERDHFLSVLKTCIRHQNLGKVKIHVCEGRVYTEKVLEFKGENVTILKTTAENFKCITLENCSH